MFSQDRKKQREFLAKSWQKYTNNKPLEPLEKQLVSIIEIHPEYHDLIVNIDSECFPEQGGVNPFLARTLTTAALSKVGGRKNKDAVRDALLAGIGGMPLDSFSANSITLFLSVL